MAKKHKSNVRYAENKAAKIGTELICPICGKTFTKTFDLDGQFDELGY